jgi:fatty-acyl-CoA synthase
MDTLHVLLVVMVLSIVPAIALAANPRVSLQFTQLMRRFGNIEMDLKLGIAAGITFLSELWWLMTGRVSFVHRINNTVQKYSNKTALVFEDAEYTWKELDEASNRMANWLLQQNVQPGAYIAMYMTNSDLFIITWVAVLKCGCTAAFINSQITKDVLLDALETSTANLLITDQYGIVAIKECYVKGMTVQQYEKINLGEVSPSAPAVKLNLSTTATAILVYTSGTTGKSKAAKVSHLRWFVGSSMFRWFVGIQSQDRYYVCLPLYHASASMLATGMCFLSGATLVLARKFSATNFFPDCVKHDCTVVQYVGELARYLLATPSSPSDTAHRVRLAVGNGMRKDTWHAFKTRFNIPCVCEFYGSSEGINMFANLNSTVSGEGAIGHRGLLGRTFDRNLRIIKFDADKEEPIRGENGFCIDADFDEPGELLNAVVSWDPARQFGGYHNNKKATSKKIYVDVFRKGDAWFSSGDLVKLSVHGYYYFVDRVGDTHRWKGENVATQQTEHAILSSSQNDKIYLLNVYGVEIPGQEGRAGCVACVLNSDTDLDFEILAKDAIQSLPRYAVPVFLRLMKELPTTSTMKLPKVQLKGEGVDPAHVQDVYVLRAGGTSYEPLTPSLWGQIVKGQVKV